MNAPALARAASRSPAAARRSAHALAQLAGGAIGEGDREDPPGRDPVLDDGAHVALDEHAGLAAAGVGGQRELAVAALDRVALLGSELRDGGSSRLGAADRRVAADALVGAARPGAARARRRPSRRPLRRAAASCGLDQRAQLALAQAVVVDQRDARVDVGAHGAARAKIGDPQRLVEAAERAKVQQLLDREHVERRLQASLLAPAGRRQVPAPRPCSR